MGCVFNALPYSQVPQHQASQILTSLAAHSSVQGRLAWCLFEVTSQTRKSLICTRSIRLDLVCRDLPWDWQGKWYLKIRALPALGYAMRSSLLLPPSYKTFRLVEVTGATEWLGPWKWDLLSLSLALMCSMASLSEGCCFSLYICFSVLMPAGLFAPCWAPSLIMLPYNISVHKVIRDPLSPQGLLCASAAS